MSIAVGKVSVFGAPGTVTLTGTGLLGATGIANQSMGVDRDYQTAELMDGAGVRIAKYFFQPGARCSLEFTPFDPTNPGNLATLTAKVKLPDPGSIVTIASSASPEFDGTWNYSGKGSIRASNRGFVVMTMELERPGESSNQPVSMAAA